MKPTVKRQEIEAIANSEHRDPFEILGMHQIKHNGKPAIAVRAYFYDVTQSWVYLPDEDTLYPMEQLPNTGYFEAIFPDRQEMFRYQLETLDQQGTRTRFYDVYAFWPVLSEEDLYLFGEGRHYKIYEKLGCHLMQHNEVDGALFAVWAPNAKRVSVVGDFNQWDGRRHPMRMRGSSGIWELFIPELTEGHLYKFEIKTQIGHLYVKTDPYAFYCQQRPQTASIIKNIDTFTWDDQDWIIRRGHENPLKKPISIYEVHLGSWMRIEEDNNRFLTYQELADKLIPYVKELGFTHLELLPVAEHPLDASWGYQVTGYYAPTSRYGTPEEFMAFVNACHREGIGVIVDWVPAHFPRDSYALPYFDGTFLYEHADPRLGEHKDWGTLIFNYGRNEVRNFLVANALFWFEKYHIDGIRVDAVASMLYLDYSREEGDWIPNRFGGRENLEAIEFIKELNEKIYEYFPGVMTIAEESTSWPGVTHPVYLGGLGFLFKWNMGWMNDMLTYMSKDPIFRRYHHNMITFALLYAFHENFMLVLSHDEVVHGKRSLLDKMPGDVWQKFANLRTLYGFMLGHPGKQLLFMGGEFGQWFEWNSDKGLDWNLMEYDHHRFLQRYVRDLNRVYTSEPALFRHDENWQSFEWIDFYDSDNSVISFLRNSLERQEDTLVFVCNFTPLPHHGYRIGVPFPGYYREIINSDAEIYGGSGVGNGGGCMAEPTPWQGHPYSLNLSLPPLGTLVFKVS
ncbi:1,4-alpha-glucan branching protein GlgB [candidate division KSB3 bacterium]|uniref:1,4-alpha-glucan branching enzyme GlgB n=1 Tax=candidate division KSB3 bacterium TaxID=2044937 RepID=A0A9D5JY52_9BACT|nr:1,4-alpha-glucan branching protein GlgB [candidate division KSB3 bacterium]MBD3326393.1 1,4-alpha-glucan branching protein GlgB [candidate division KSB3 bacterium]